jgi:hypothetical protein
VTIEWANRKPPKKENAAKAPDPAADADLTVRSSAVTIYICVGNVSGKSPRNSGSRNTSNRGKA